jgi:serine/threonine protein phosphatase 1
MVEPIPQVLDFIIDLVNRTVCICGNQDDLLLECIDESKDNLLWYKHGEADFWPTNC